MLSADVTALLVRASEELEGHSEGPIPPEVMGLIGFVILMGLLFATMAIGGGREHS